MIETGRRDVVDVATRLRIARHLGLPPHILGVTDPDNADVAAMLQFGESTLRLASLARRSGHGVAASRRSTNCGRWSQVWKPAPPTVSSDATR
jgi:hypothetical protein